MTMLAFSLKQLAERVGGRVVGDAERMLHGVGTLDSATPDQLGFLTNPRYRSQAVASSAGALLVAPGEDVGDRDRIEVAQPYVALATVLELFHPPLPRHPGVSPLSSIGAGVSLGDEPSIAPFAVVEDHARLGHRVTLGPGCVVGRGSSVGDETELRARVVLYAGTRVGARCLIHAGVVLGADGFGFATADGEHRKVPQVGTVVIEDDVEIGANSTIDRGALGETRIGRGTKIDNLVMVAHGVELGPRCLLAAQVGISGSTRVGEAVTFAGQSGAAGHLDIAAGSVIAGKTAVFQSIPEAAFVAGVPAVDHRAWKRSAAALKRLPDMMKQLRELERRVAELEGKD